MVPWYQAPSYSRAPRHNSIPRSTEVTNGMPGGDPALNAQWIAGDMADPRTPVSPYDDDGLMLSGAVNGDQNRQVAGMASDDERDRYPGPLGLEDPPQFVPPKPRCTYHSITSIGWERRSGPKFSEQDYGHWSIMGPMNATNTHKLQESQRSCVRSFWHGPPPPRKSSGAWQVLPTPEPGWWKSLTVGQGRTSTGQGLGRTEVSRRALNLSRKRTGVMHVVPSAGRRAGRSLPVSVARTRRGAYYRKNLTMVPSENEDEDEEDEEDDLSGFVEPDEELPRRRKTRETRSKTRNATQPPLEDSSTETISDVPRRRRYGRARETSVIPRRHKCPDSASATDLPSLLLRQQQLQEQIADLAEHIEKAQRKQRQAARSHSRRRPRRKVQRSTTSSSSSGEAPEIPLAFRKSSVGMVAANSEATGLAGRRRRMGMAKRSPSPPRTQLRVVSDNQEDSSTSDMGSGVIPRHSMARETIEDLEVISERPGIDELLRQAHSATRSRRARPQAASAPMAKSSPFSNRPAASVSGAYNPKRGHISVSLGKPVLPSPGKEATGEYSTGQDPVADASGTPHIQRVPMPRGMSLSVEIPPLTDAQRWRYEVALSRAVPHSSAGEISQRTATQQDLDLESRLVPKLREKREAETQRKRRRSGSPISLE